MTLRTLIKTTLDGRKLEVIGLAICLDGELEAFELIDVKMHPNGYKIHEAAPEASHVAGRVTLTPDEARAVLAAIEQANKEIMSDPIAINERFRIAAMWKARELGIE